mgnify:CR=1 FL=1
MTGTLINIAFPAGRLFEWSWSSGSVEQSIHSMLGPDTHAHGMNDFHWSRSAAAAFKNGILHFTYSFENEDMAPVAVLNPNRKER